MKLLRNIIGICIILASTGLSAQKISINPFIGYTFQNKFRISGGDCTLKDGTTYGATLAIPMSKNSAVEILYSRQETQLRAYSYLFDNGTPFIEDVAMNYIMIGGKRIFPSVDDDVQFYGGMKVGAAVLSSTNDNYNSITRFAAGLNLGFAYYLSEALGIHGGANLNFPITDIGAGLGWSSSGGASVGVTGWSPIVQFSFVGGLSLRLGN